MSCCDTPDDGLCNPAITIAARRLPGTVCVAGGAACPLFAAIQEARAILDRVKRDPAVSIRLTSDADCVRHYRARGPGGCTPPDRDAMLNRARDLDVLLGLGLAPGDTRRSRYLYTLLFERIETLDGICACDSEGWEGCPLARSGAYESVRRQGWKAVVFDRTEEDKAEARRLSVERIRNDDTLFVRLHHLMCLACWYGSTEGKTPRPDDTLDEIYHRIRRDPEVRITLIEGQCEACHCCDGFHPESTRCVHDGGLIRDYKKDLDCFRKLGLTPGATMPARDIFRLLFERIRSTTEICGYGDGVATSREWQVCGGPGGNPGYARARETLVF